MNAAAEYDIAGLGASTLDILTQVAIFPTRREVKEAAELKLAGGGPVATALAAAAKLGGTCLMLDALGDDDMGRAIVADFQKYGVDTRALKLLGGERSAAASVVVNENGERAVYFKRGTTEIIPKDLRAELLAEIPRAKILHINGRHFDMLEEAIFRARRAGVLVSFDGGADRYSAEMRELAASADICIVTRDFAEKYTGTADLREATNALFTAATKIAGVTDGIHGSYMRVRGGDIIHQPAFPQTRIVDTTGCGDSYHGAFLYGLTQRMSVSRSAELASAVASMNTQGLGGREALPTLYEAENFIRNAAN